MAIQRAHLGLFAAQLPCDVDGFVPTGADGPWDLTIDHAGEATHDDAGVLTPYGHWWIEIGWPDFQARCMERAAVAQAALSEWRRKPTSRRI